MANTKITLPPILATPTLLQYSVPRVSPKARPIYKPVFRPNNDALTTLSLPFLTHTDPSMPPYPYAASAQSAAHYFKESTQGLYGGAVVQSGNKISKGRNKGKTLRKWFPNVRVEKLRSEALGVELSLPTTARVMRTITKVGGLDKYLLGESQARIKELGLLGWKLRWAVVNSEKVKAERDAERAALRIEDSAQKEFATFEEAWQDQATRERLMSKVAERWEKLKEKDERFRRHVKETLRWEEPVKRMATLHLQDPVKAVEDCYVVEAKDKKVDELREKLAVPRGFGIQQIEEAGEEGGKEKVTA